MTNIKKIVGPTTWKSTDLYNSTDWIYKVNENDKKELEDALEHLKKRSIHNFDVQKQDFPLDNLGKKLEFIRNYLEENKGIFLIREIPLNNYNNEDIRLIYAGIGAYIGTKISQSLQGELVHDVCDSGKCLTDKTSRGTITKDDLPFHTDRCDVVTLLCLHQAKSGGQSRVASAASVHNEMLHKRPDLLEQLYQPYYHARAAWESTEENSHYPLPIYTCFAGKVSVRYLRHFINVAQTIPGVPKMTSAQVEALTLFEQLVSDPELCVDLDFQPGDIQLLNNFENVHSRSSYEDFATENKKRHLLRLWLSVPNSRALSPQFAPLYNNTGAGEIRGGLTQKGSVAA